MPVCRRSRPRVPVGRRLFQYAGHDVAPWRYGVALVRSEETAMHAMDMIKSHPEVRGNTNDVLVRCIEECLRLRHDLHLVCRRLHWRRRSAMELRQCIRLEPRLRGPLPRHGRACVTPHRQQ